MPTETYNPAPLEIGRYKTDYGGDDSIKIVPKTGHKDLIWTGGHYGWPRPRGRPDVGGSFLTNYTVTEAGLSGQVNVQGGTAYAEHHYHGCMSCSVGLQALLPVAKPDIFGAALYSRMKPDKPNLQGLNAIYELKDVPEMLKTGFLKNGLPEIGNYYLALKFGWEPLLRDIRDFVLTQMNAQKRLKQLLRDEGKPVTRKVSLGDLGGNPVDSNERYTENVLGPSFVTYFYRKDGNSTIRRSYSDTAWGVARFRYWLPGGPRDVNWKRSMLAKIFGFKPTPKVVWNAIPWSWLIDWFTGVGDLIDNLDTSLVDRLAADYFYVMRQKEYLVTKTSTEYLIEHKTMRPIEATATGTARTGSKCRMVGDPFGWASSQQSLSGVQLSILGALGLSRLR